jgi:Tfp pilus assembly protein PilV
MGASAAFSLTPSNRGAHRQRGVTLIEALLAFLVLAGGVLSMARLQLHLQAHADLARQRSEAMRIAQEDIESLRAFAFLQADAAASGALAYERIETVTSSVENLNGAALNTVFQLTRQIDDSSAARLKAATVSVAWRARDGSAQQAVLNSVVTGVSPALAGALTVAPSLLTPASGYARSPGIPVNAKNLGDGRSVLKPGAGTIAYVFDNLSAQVTQRCTDVASDRTTAQLSTTDLRHCSELHGLWLSGTVRFSNANPPSSDAANDMPLDLNLLVTLTGVANAASPSCSTEALKTVQYRAANGIRREAVPLAAMPTSVGVAEWSELGERYVAYQCVVPITGAAGRWSGRSSLVPLGWTLGTSAADRKVCRYAADMDHSGTIDRNEEHPSTYAAVDRSLMQQNFLVIRGDQACPGDSAARIDTGDVADATSATPITTVPHQP